MYDGTLYRSLSHAGGFQSNTQWNTDGVPLFLSSSFCMWPFYLKINELPHVSRNCISNCISNKVLAGVWFGNKKTAINTFLKPICEAMNTLFYRGIIVYPPERSTPITCRGIVLSGTSDIPAKCTALNMIGHNGFFWLLLLRTAREDSLGW